MKIIKSFSGLKGSIALLVIVVLWSVLLTIPLQIDLNSTAAKLVFTSLGWIPLLLSLVVVFVNYFIVMFNDDPDDDSGINLVPMILTATSLTLSWAPVFMITWVWDPTTWTGTIPTAFEAFLRFSGMALTMAAGIGFETHVPREGYSDLLAGVMGFSTQVIVIGIAVSTTIQVVTDRISRAGKASTPTSTPTSTSEPQHRYETFTVRPRLETYSALDFSVPYGGEESKLE